MPKILCILILVFLASCSSRVYSGTNADDEVPAILKAHGVTIRKIGSEQVGSLSSSVRVSPGSHEVWVTADAAVTLRESGPDAEWDASRACWGWGLGLELGLWLELGLGLWLWLGLGLGLGQGLWPVLELGLWLGLGLLDRGTFEG